ncbi:MAG: hypothetical protein AB7Q01_08480 [Gammaproteobacteria bacterium]
MNKHVVYLVVSGRFETEDITELVEVMEAVNGALEQLEEHGSLTPVIRVEPVEESNGQVRATNAG